MSPCVSEVSIITVNWNGKAHLKALLPSLLPLGAQEIIVVDNGSRDGSVEFLRKSYPAVRILRNEINRGFCQPNNLAAQASKGSILAFINNDMRAHPEWLQEGVAGLQEAPCVASRILDWKGERVDFNGSSLHYLGYAVQRDIDELVDSVSHSDRVLFPCGGAMLIEKETFLELGGFDESFFAIFEDVDLGWRLWLSGFEVVFRPASITYHRRHSTFSSQFPAKMRYLMHRNALQVIIKNYEEENLTRILPIALLMSIRRAIRCSGVEKDSFYLWSATSSRLEQQDATAYQDVLDALNHLVSLDDVIQSMPSLMERRAAVQQRRRRSDSEILALFEDPLRAIVEDSDYIEEEADLLVRMGLTNLFDVARYRSSSESFKRRLRPSRKRLEAELRALQWTGVQALLHPPGLPTRRSRLARFLETWRDSGLGTAIRLSLEALRRGS